MCGLSIARMKTWQQYFHRKKKIQCKFKYTHRTSSNAHFLLETQNTVFQVAKKTNICVTFFDMISESAEDSD